MNGHFIKTVKRIVGLAFFALTLLTWSTSAKADGTCNVACSNFSFVDHNGNRVNNSTIQGKTTIMMFSTDYCTYGKAMLNEIGKSDWFPNDNVNFIFGMIDGTEASIKEYQQIYSYDGMQFCYTENSSDMIRIAFDMFQRTGGTGNTINTPLTFIIDGNGTIRYCMESYVEIADLEGILDDYADLTYSVNDANILAQISSAECIYNSFAHTPKVTVTKRYYNVMLYEGTNYTITYENNVNAGTAYAVITGKGYMVGTKKIPFVISPCKLTTDCVGTISEQKYTGSLVQPSFSVVCNGRTLTAGKDYNLTYANNMNPGTATITITGIGNYTGTVRKNFTIKQVSSFTVSSQKYKVTNTAKKTVEFTGTSKKKSKVTIPSYITYRNVKYKVTSVSTKAFRNDKNVTSISVATSVTKIPAAAFQGCTKLTTVTLGKSIQSIGKNAFSGCKNLKKITIKSTKLKTVGKNALKGVHRNCKIKVPKAKLSNYKILFKNKGQKKTVKVIK